MWIAQGVIPLALAMIIVMSLARIFVSRPIDDATPGDALGRDG
jgi:hypothetical protein